jgi:hypothetical protein
MVLYADYISLVITGTNPVQFSIDVNMVFNNFNEWVRSNLMFLNIEKTHFLQFRTKNIHKINLNITLAEEYITNTTNIKFLGLIIDKNLSWKCHIEQALIKLSSACYAMKVVTPLKAEETLRMIYFTYVHSLLSYGIILWGNSSHSYSVLRMQKHILQIMTKSGYRDSCRQLFKNLGILPLYSQYIFSLMLFVVRNTHLYVTNQETHGVNTRYNTDFYFPTVRLTAFKDGSYFMGMKIFNHLPSNIKMLLNRIELFKPALKKYLL